MAYNHESYYSSFDESFNDPRPFGEDDNDDTYLGSAPILDWSAFDRSFAGTHPLHDCSLSPQSLDSPYSGTVSIPSQLRDRTSFSSAYSEAACVPDWRLPEETVTFSPVLAPTQRYPNFENSPMTYTISPAATLHPQKASSSSSPSPVSDQSESSSKVAIQRARPRHRKASNRAPASKVRYQCTEGRCRVSFSRQSDLHRHTADVHGRSDNTFNCNSCVYYSRRGDKVKEHCQKMHHQPRGLEQFTITTIAKS